MTQTRAEKPARHREPANRDASTPTMLIRKALVANRGEIACRVMRTCRSLGIATVAVFSDADATARHVREADEAIHIGASAASASYLAIPALLAAARRTGADAIHPGYGFLAENADFAAACEETGLTFIGPTSDVIRRMGSKREAKRLATGAGVPVVPGYEGDDISDARLIAAAREIGYPVMVKASAGGGGKGMRIVTRASDLPNALASARREALSAFGDETLLLEKALVEPRHIEIQIFGDAHGHVIALGERECSIQRRHQKVIEETPSTAVSPDLRARMSAAAVAIGRTLDYTGAGTVEFILDRDGAFYFLEVNTRLQVEHPVTELVTGLDLVRWQMLVAEGHPLPLTQDEIRFSGHAVEARVYAEDPAGGFLPQAGTVALWRPPEGDGVRVDAGVETDDSISPYYDPMVAKISAFGATRDDALRRLDAALRRTVLFGVRSNLDYVRRVLLHPDHRAGHISTAFLEQHAADLLPAMPAEPIGGLAPAQLAALAITMQRLTATPTPATWRNNRSRPLLEHYRQPNGGETALHLTPERAGAFAVTFDDEPQMYAVQVRERNGPDITLEIDGHVLRATAMEAQPEEWWAHVAGETLSLTRRSPLPLPGVARASNDALTAPMPGQVIGVLVSEGQAVAAGDPLMILEAMKMEHTIRAPHDGVVSAIHYQPGDQVRAAAVLLDVRAGTPSPS
ncbi:MAG TPA: biotin carboxylase N-terminal domain-containing protein [Ktedonobacterales bacterium]|nr:biotin carboxylase N-terminal domain-containing protein [Ktedonobacterales bacterium]